MGKFNPWHSKDYIGCRVKVLTVTGKPTGYITNGQTPLVGSLHPGYMQHTFWVRLKGGVLLKDVSLNEIEVVDAPKPKKKNNVSYLW